MRVLALIQPCDFTPGANDGAGRSGVSHCRACKRDVHDLSAMTGDEAAAFLARRGPRDCVRFQKDENDLIHFADGPNGLVGRIAHNARPMISVASLLLAACTNPPDQDGHGESTAKPTAVEVTSAAASATSLEVREDGGATASASASAVAAPPAPSAATSACTPVASAKVGSGGRGTPKPLTTINGYF